MIGYPHGSQYNPNKSFVNKKKFIKFSVVSVENFNCHYLKTPKNQGGHNLEKPGKTWNFHDMSSRPGKHLEF